jgi:hypothetical protein
LAQNALRDKSHKTLLAKIALRNLRSWDKTPYVSYGTSLAELTIVHIMLRDLLTQKCVHKKRLLISDTPEHVDSENIKF